MTLNDTTKLRTWPEYTVMPRCAQVRHDDPLWNGSFYATRRKFCADCGGAQLAGRQAVIADGQKLGLKRLFMAHPPLGECIAACATVPGNIGAAA